MYIEPEELESSYKLNNLGKTLYDKVIELKPNKIIDFGVLDGYSTIVLAQACKDNGFGRVKVYDLFEKYSFNHSKFDKLIRNIKDYGVADYIDIEQVNFFDWIKNPEDFDLLHLDISNDGDIIDLAWNKLQGQNVIFEGGSEQRDKVGWIVKYNKKPIGKSKANYKVIDDRFPSISMFI